jgi:NAD+ synthase (glutamine-hydrolysing)
VYVNLIGGQDELVFDGGSFVVNANGKLCQIASSFEEELCLVEFQDKNDIWGPKPRRIDKEQPLIESTYRALVLGAQDYIKKNGFSGAIIGLSGGIDSALTLAIAVDAVGADNVEAVMMPSRYTSELSLFLRP